MRGPGIFALPAATVPRTAVASIPQMPESVAVVAGSGGARQGGARSSGSRLAGMTAVVSAVYAPAWSAQLVASGGAPESEEFDADTDADAARHAVRSGASSVNTRADDGTGSAPARSPRPKQERIVASPDAVPGSSRIHTSSPEERAAAQSAVTAATTDELPAARPPNSQPPGRSPAMPEEPSAPIDTDRAIRPPAAPGDPSLQFAALARQGAPSLSPPAAPSLSSIASGAGAFTRPEKPSPPKWRPPKASPKNGWGESMSGPLGTAAGPGGMGPGGTAGSTRGLSGFGGQTPGGGGGGKQGERPIGPDGLPIPDPKPRRPASTREREERERQTTVADAAARAAAARARAAAAAKRAAEAYAAYQKAVQSGASDSIVKDLAEKAKVTSDADKEAQKDLSAADDAHAAATSWAETTGRRGTVGQRQRRERRAAREEREDERRQAREAPEERRKRRKTERQEEREFDRKLAEVARRRSASGNDDYRRLGAAIGSILAGSAAGRAESASDAASNAAADYRYNMSGAARDEAGARAAAGRQAQATREVARETEAAARSAERTAKYLGSRGDPKANAAAKDAAKRARGAAEKARKAADAVDKARRRAERANTSANRKALDNAIKASEKAQKEAAAAARKAAEAAAAAKKAADAKRAAKKKKPKAPDDSSGSSKDSETPPEVPPKPRVTSWTLAEPEPCDTLECPGCAEAGLECNADERCVCSKEYVGTRPIPVKATVPDGAAIPAGPAAPQPPDDVPRDAGTTGPAPNPAAAGAQAISPSSHPSGSLKAVFPKDARTDKNAMDAKAPPMTVANPFDQRDYDLFDAWMILQGELRDRSPGERGAFLSLHIHQLESEIRTLEARATVGTSVGHQWPGESDDDYRRRSASAGEERSRAEADLARRRAELDLASSMSQRLSGSGDAGDDLWLTDRSHPISGLLDQWREETARRTAEIEFSRHGELNPWDIEEFREVASRLGVPFDASAAGIDDADFQRVTRIVWAQWVYESAARVLDAKQRLAAAQAEFDAGGYYERWARNYAAGFDVFGHWDRYAAMAAASDEASDVNALVAAGSLRTFVNVIWLPFWALYGPALSNPYLAEDVIGPAVDALVGALEELGAALGLSEAELQLLIDFVLFLLASAGAKNAYARIECELRCVRLRAGGVVKRARGAWRRHAGDDLRKVDIKQEVEPEASRGTAGEAAPRGRSPAATAIERAKAAGTDQASRARAFEETAREFERAGRWEQGSRSVDGTLGEKVYMGKYGETVVIDKSGTIWRSARGTSPFDLTRPSAGNVDVVEINYGKFTKQ